jgi:hypothetical protein
MSGIPVHVQRSFEQRWAAKLASSGASAAPKSADLKGTVNSSPRPTRAKGAHPRCPCADSGRPTGVRRRLKPSVQAKRPQCGASEAA